MKPLPVLLSVMALGLLAGSASAQVRWYRPPVVVPPYGYGYGYYGGGYNDGYYGSSYRRGGRGYYNRGYGGNYYGTPNVGYREFRGGGGQVNVGGLQFGWR